MEEGPRLAMGAFDLLEAPTLPRPPGDTDSARALVTIYMQTYREREAME